jgi:hypothetical protein
MSITSTSARGRAIPAPQLPVLTLVVLLLALAVPAAAAAFSVGPRYGTGSSVSQKSSRDTNVVFSWLHPGNIGADDDATAMLGLPAVSLGYEDWAGWYAELVASGFDFSSIPDEALIDGVKVEIKRAQFGAGSPLLRDNEVALTLDDPTVRSVNRADRSSTWPTLSSIGTATYGGPSDLWGLDLTTAQVKSPGFAVTMSVKNFWPLAETTLACVDSIRVTIEYTLPLTITAKDQTKTYGDAIDFSGTEFTTTGLQPGDSVDSVDFACTGAAGSAAVAGSPYAITPSRATGTDLDDYVITYVPGEMTVTPRDLSVTATAGDKVYDGTTAADVTLHTDALPGASLIASCTGARFTSPDAGSAKTVVVDGIVVSGADAGDYHLRSTSTSTEAGITPRPVTIAAVDQVKPFGQSFSFTGTEFTTSGLIAGDSVASVTLASAGTAAGAAGGTYPNKASDAAGTCLADYLITYVPGTITVGSSCSVGSFARPLRSTDGRVFRRGDSVCVSFRVLDQSGRSVVTLTPQLTVRRGAKTRLRPTAVTYSSAKSAYVYRLTTKGWRAGKYRVGVTLPDGSKGRSVTFTLVR